jgi:hypothetical protein
VVTLGEPYAATIATHVRKENIFGRETWVVGFEFYNPWELRDALVIESLKGDTLVLVDNAIDSFGYFMTKQ